MEKFIILKEELKIKGKTGFNSTLGGFFIIDRNSTIPHSEYVEVEIVKEILDKRNKKVKIVSLKEHNHSIATPIDKYYRSEYCLICTECSYRRKHSFEFVYQIKDKYKHIVRKKCTNCGYEEEVEEHHDEFEITEKENKRIKKCRCGYEEVEAIQKLEEREVKKLENHLKHLREQKLKIKVKIQDLENQEKKVKEEIEKLKLQLRINLPNDIRFTIRRYSNDVLVNEVVLDLSDLEKIKGIYSMKNCSFLWKSEVEIYSENVTETVTELEKDEVPKNVVEYLRKKIKEKEGVIQLLKDHVNQLEEIRMKLRELYNENGKLYDEINQIEKILENQR